MFLDWKDHSLHHLRRVSKVLSVSSLVHDNEDLALVCSSLVGVPCKRTDVSHSSAVVPSTSHLKFHNVLESFLDRASSVGDAHVDSDLRRIFGDILNGVGIVEITGPSGSGKTSFCVSFANSSRNLTLYIDTTGSLAVERLTTPSNLIYLRVFNCEELEAVVSDFERLLLEDKFLPIKGCIPARAVSNLIIDSLWPVSLLDHIHRLRYLFRLSVYLRHIAWRNKIAVLVCSNNNKGEVRPFTNVKVGSSASSHERWRSRCYMHVSLEQGVLYGDGATACSSSPITHPADCDTYRFDSEVVSGSSCSMRRMMSINTGGDYCRRWFDFGIKHHQLVLYDP